MRHPAAALLLALVAPAALAGNPAPEPDALTRSLLKRAEFEQFRLSPNGELVAIERRMPEGSVVSIHRRDTLAPVLQLDPGKLGEISEITWLDDQRIIVGANRADSYYGMSMVDPVLSVVRVDGKDSFQLPGTFFSTVEDDPDHILVSRCSPSSSGGHCIPQLRLADINKLRKMGELLVEGPADTSLFADRKGKVRFAFGEEDDGTTKAWVRDAAGAWTVFNDSAKTGVDVTPLAVSRDGTYGLLQSQRKQGTDLVERYDFATGARTPVYENAASDPIRLLYSLDGKDVVGARFQPTRPTVEFWDKEHPDTGILASLHHAFPGREVFVHSASKDGQWIVVLATSDRDPGTFYLFNRKAMSAKPLSRRKPWIEPNSQARQSTLDFNSRDGVPMHGVLTLPPQSGKPYPLVVLPHGGPFEVFDEWGYDPETQLLAQHGYAVLQVNFRGSGGYGRAFADSGLRQWGGAMQNDIADATRFAIAQGNIDSKRVCIYGASYGGYAALMEPIRDPDLYRCAVAVSGPYDLAKMFKWGSIRGTDYGKLYLERALGKDPVELAANSPLQQVDRIKLPVLLVHGRLDGRVDVKHAHRMLEALQARKAPVEYWEVPQTGHSIVIDRYELEFYARLLDFLGRNIGDQTAVAAH